MINDIKLGCKLLKYGHNAKLSIVLSIIMAIFSVFYSILSIVASSNFPGGYFFMLSALLLVQLLCTVNAAGLVAASPARKRLQTRIPALISTATMLAAHLINVVSLGIFASIRPEAMGSVCILIITTTLIMGLVMMYVGVCYKYFVLGTIVFVIGFAVLYGAMVYGVLRQNLTRGFLPLESLWGNFWLASALGLGIILVCGLLEYLLTLATYKAPISKLALGARLRGQM